jgi:hypothetical protein
MIFQATLAFRGFRYLWVALVLVAGSSIIFATQTGSIQARGDTWQGYTLGTAAALVMVWLTFLGIRKRRYRSTLGTVQGWTSAHIYIGLAVVAMATLHCAGQFHANIHTYAYVLMCAVVATGIVGVVGYMSIPRRLMDNRGISSRAELFSELFELDRQARDLAIRCDADTGGAVRSSIERTVVGGGFVVQLCGIDRSLFEESATGGGGVKANRDQAVVLALIATRVPRALRPPEAAALQTLLVNLSRRQTVLRRLRRDIQLQAWLKVWLYLHIPLTVAALAALIVHILTTFMDW